MALKTLTFKLELQSPATSLQQQLWRAVVPPQQSTSDVHVQVQAFYESGRQLQQPINLVECVRYNNMEGEDGRLLMAILRMQGHLDNVLTVTNGQGHLVLEKKINELDSDQTFMLDCDADITFEINVYFSPYCKVFFRDG